MSQLYSRRGFLKSLAASLGVVVLGTLYTSKSFGLLSGMYGDSYGGIYDGSYGGFDYQYNRPGYGWLCDNDGSNCDYLPISEIQEILKRP